MTTDEDVLRQAKVIRGAVYEFLAACDDEDVDGVARAIATLREVLAGPEPVAPPARRPLTDADIDEAITIAGVDGVRESIRKIARAVERAHGIGGNDE